MEVYEAFPSNNHTVTSSPEKERLLTLKEAASVLGLHPATLRRWANRGDIHVVLTPGGHRRFPQREVIRLGKVMLDPTLASDTVEIESKHTSFEETALQHARHGIEEHSKNSWQKGLTEDDLQEKRALGRRLVTLVTNYLRDGNDAHIEEARAIGRLYGKSAKESGLHLSDALKATFFFRRHIMESAIISEETGRVRHDMDREALKRLDNFLNSVELSIAEMLER